MSPEFFVMARARRRGGNGSEAGMMAVPAQRLAAVQQASERARLRNDGPELGSVVLPGLRLLPPSEFLPVLEGADRVRPRKDLVTVRDLDPALGETLSGRAELTPRHVLLMGFIGDDSVHWTWPLPHVELDLLVAASQRPDRVGRCLERAARRNPNSVARALTDYPDGEYALLAPLRHTFPDGLPADLFRALLASDHAGLREAAITALGRRPSARRAP